jgi:hypothetical protein
MTGKGHSQPMHSVPGPINVRCYSNSDIIVRRSELTLRAITGSRLAICFAAVIRSQRGNWGAVVEP